MKVYHFCIRYMTEPAAPYHSLPVKTLFGIPSPPPLNGNLVTGTFTINCSKLVIKGDQIF